MNVRSVFAVLLVSCLFVVAGSQNQTEQQKKSDEILAKFRKLEIYNQLLPVLMTQDQVRALLPVLEKHRSDAEKLENAEYKWLQGMDKTYSDALGAAESKGALPDSKMMDQTVAAFDDFVKRRKTLVALTVAELMKTMKEKLNDGQVRAAANAFDPRGLSLTKPADQLTEDEKLDAWIRVVLLDNHTYHILVDMAAKK